MEPQKFLWRSRLKSFVFAFEGVIIFFRREHNARIHGVVALLVLISSFLMKLSTVEMILIILSIGLVWITEIINTAIEKTMDYLSPQQHPAVKVIKDLSAGAVLIAAMVAVIIGSIIFIPKFL